MEICEATLKFISFSGHPCGECYFLCCTLRQNKTFIFSFLHFPSTANVFFDFIWLFPEELLFVNDTARKLRVNGNASGLSKMENLKLLFAKGASGLLGRAVAFSLLKPEHQGQAL
jgi:hypothetical protein